MYVALELFQRIDEKFDPGILDLEITRPEL